ncbi:MAG: pyruvate kinase alpha/beta domain-containing protein, partial [Desulfuromonadaceae bacterium]|nr:pyruvate kinase alpha/beta domain-containing protein [Desulfuromonadaceae bacterium]
TRTQGRAAPCLISRFRPDSWILSHGGDEKTNNLLSLSYGVHPITLDNNEISMARKTAAWLVATGTVAKEEKLVWVEDEASADRLETLSIKIINA